MKPVLLFTILILGNLALAGDLKITENLVELGIVSGQRNCFDGKVFRACPPIKATITSRKDQIPAKDVVVIKTHLSPMTCFSSFPSIKGVKALSDEGGVVRFFSEMPAGVWSSCEGLPAREMEFELSGYDHMVFRLKQDNAPQPPLYTVVTFDVSLEGNCKAKVPDCVYRIKNLSILPNQK